MKLSRRHWIGTTLAALAAAVLPALPARPAQAALPPPLGPAPPPRKRKRWIGHH